MIRAKHPVQQKEVVVFTFATKLGWMAILGVNGALARLTFGQNSAGDALRALDDARVAEARLANWHPTLVRRLRALASGTAVDFSDIAVEMGRRTRFQERVIQACRRIPVGQTRTYAQLAALAGSPRAARAVGNVMATNPVPLVVPCHRVLGSGGGWGGYSGGEGISTKRRLLAAEAGRLSTATASPSRQRRVRVASPGDRCRATVV